MAVVLMLPAHAGQKTSAFSISQKITGTCSVTAPDLDFGSQPQVLGTEVVNGTIKVNCSKGLAFRLSFSATANTTSLSANLIGLKTGNTDRIPFTVTRTGSTGVGGGMTAANTINFPVRANLTTPSTPRVDTYIRARTIYINY
jgi:spore coat protein U-like protein